MPFGENGANGSENHWEEGGGRNWGTPREDEGEMIREKYLYRRGSGSGGKLDLIEGNRMERIISVGIWNIRMDEL